MGKGSKATATTDPYERDDIEDRTGESGEDAAGFGHDAPEERPAGKRPRRARRSASGQHNDDAEPLMDEMATEYDRDQPPGAGVAPQWDDPASAYSQLRDKAGALEADLAALKAVLARGTHARAGGHATHSMPPGSPADQPGGVLADVVDQQPASLPGGPRETLSQDYMKANFNRGEVTVQHLNLRGSAGHYAGQQQVDQSPMDRAVEMSSLVPSSGSGGYAAPHQGLTARAPGEAR